MRSYLPLVCILSLSGCDLHNLRDGGGVRLDVPRFVYHNNPTIRYTIDGAWHAEISFALLCPNREWLPQPKLTRVFTARSGSFQPNTPLQNGLYRLRSKLITERGGIRVVLGQYQEVRFMDVVTEPLVLRWPTPSPPPSPPYHTFSFHMIGGDRIAVTVNLHQPPVSGLRPNSDMALVFRGANNVFEFPNAPNIDDIVRFTHGYPNSTGGRLYTFWPYPHHAQIEPGSLVRLVLLNLVESPDPDHLRILDVNLP